MKKPPIYLLPLHEAVAAAADGLEETALYGRCEALSLIIGKAKSTVAGYCEVPKDDGGSGSDITAQGIRKIYEAGTTSNELLTWLAAGKWIVLPASEVKGVDGSTLDEFFTLIRASGDYASVAKIPLRQMTSLERKRALQFRAQLLAIYQRIGAELNAIEDK